MIIQKVMNKNQTYMWEEKISKLLFRQSAPAIIWMLVMSLYNFVDTIFIGRGVGTEGIAAVSIVFPIQMIIWAFAMALGIWASSIISRKLWQKEYEEVSKVFWTFQSTNIIIAAIFTILWLIFIKPLLIFFGATPDILSYWVQYFSVLLLWMIFFTFNMWNNSIIRSVWHAKTAMSVMLVSSVINIILDYIFIFIFNRWIWWAAWATVISRAIASIIVLQYYLWKHNIIKTVLSDFKIRFNHLKHILAIWSSSLARQVAASAIVIFINNLLWVYWSSVAIAAYGIMNRALMVFMMPMFGVVQWMQPILWFNYGWWLHHRVRKVSVLAIKILTIFTTFVWALFLLFPWVLLNIFSTDTELLSIATKSIKILILLFPLVWFQIVASWFYQALWKAKKAFLTAIFRQVLILLPVLIILPKIYWLDGIWYSFPIADGIAAIAIYFIFIRDIKKLK